MSSTTDCEAIEKGLKDIIFGMTNTVPLQTKELDSKLHFPINVLNMEKTAVLEQSIKLPFTKLNTSEMMLNQTNSSELIDLNALTEFSAKHIDEQNFETPANEAKLPHPEEESNNGVAVLFQKIQNSPNFANLPENPLQPSMSPKRQQKVSPKNSFPIKKKRKKRKSNKPKDVLVEGVKHVDIKVLAKESKKEIQYIKPKKSSFSVIGKEYSMHMEKDDYRFQCHICNFNTDMRGNINKHLISKNHQIQKELSDKDMMLPFLPEPLPSQVEAITDLLLNQISGKALVNEDLSIRSMMSSRLLKFVRDNVPICSVSLIGSSAFGIGLKSSEVDYVLQVKSEDLIPDALEAIYNAIGKAEDFINVVANFKQKRPEVLFTDRETNLPCKVLLDNTSSLKLANILSTYCKLDSRVQVLGAAIRYWAKVCGIDQQDHGTLPSFSFSLLLVHFLQQVQPPVLPVLHEVKDFSGCPEFYEKYLQENVWRTQNTDSIGELWLKFFRYYTLEYKIGDNVVCIRTSKKGTCIERNWTTKFYAIEEPFLKRNVAYVIPTFPVCQFIQNCFIRTYRYFAYPQMQSYFPPIQLRKTDNFDALQLSEYLKKPLIKGEESDESEVSENEDSTTSTDLLNISEDLEDHDPDIPLEDLLSTVANLSLNGQIAGDDTKGENSVELPSVESDNSGTTIQNSEEKMPDKENQDKLPKLTKQAPICYWDVSGKEKELSKRQFSYEFIKSTFKGDKGVPIICKLCKKSGHLKKDCPIDEIPVPRPLPAMSQDYLDAITIALYSIYESNLVSESYFNKIECDMLDIEKSIKEVFPGAKLNLFGSFCNGFGFRNGSDMDFCLTFSEHNDGKNLDSPDVIHKVAAQLLSHPRLENVIPITSAKVPIVKFAWKDSELEGDISLYNTLALNNTKMLLAYSKIDQRVQILGYALKYFAKTLGICDASRGSLSSYAYILMVLFFLQQRNPPVIPVLQELHNGEKPIEVIDDWNGWYYKDIENLKDVWSDYGKNEESVAQLWLGLLSFYACDFDWKEYVISIKQKNLLRRFKKLWISDELAIEDPFDLNHNLGGGLSRKMNTYIVKAFIRGRERFGFPLSSEKMQTIQKRELTYLFNRNYLNSGCEPPHDRGCGNCGKIGHIRKDCPQEKTCSYCRKPGHLIKNCPRKRNYPKDPKDRNYDKGISDRRGTMEKIQNQHMAVQLPIMRNDLLVRTYPGMKMQASNQSLETQQKLLQIGIPVHRMPPPGFPGSRNLPNHPPPGFKTNGPLHQNPANYPPAFSSPHVHVPPFPQRSAKKSSQSPPKQYGTSPPRNFQLGKGSYRQPPDQTGWHVNNRQVGLQVERHPNPQLMQSHVQWQNRPVMQQRDSQPVKHKSNQQHHIDYRQTRTKSDHHPYNPSDRW